MREFTMTIAGEAVPGAAVDPVENPATGLPFAEAPVCSLGELDRAMTAAAEAGAAWRFDENTRREALAACAELVAVHAKTLAETLTREQGKPLGLAEEEVAASAAWLRYTASLELPVEVIEDSETRRLEVRRRPLGVVAAITPWNYPLLLAVWKIAPALLAGNTVVMKPSPYTPLTTLLLGEVLREALPPGVLNVVSGGDDIGVWMTQHPVPRKVAFTGSVDTGKAVSRNAAEDLKRVTLELGGNDAAIVLPDVDPDAVAPDIFWGAFANSGQVCSAIKRVYVHDELYTRLAEALAGLAAAARVGDGMQPETQLGPLNNRAQLSRVEDLVEDARAHGAHVATGGRRPPGAGFFYEPTIVTGVAEGVRLVDEEQFGPALPLVRYGDVTEAIERANATRFGLSGSVWSNDPNLACAVGERLECGTVWINQHLEILPQAPFGGAKWSGIGVENGPWGLLGFTELQTFNVRKCL